MVRVMEKLGDGGAVVRWSETDQQADCFSVRSVVQNLQDIEGNDSSNAVADEIERPVIPARVPLLGDE